MRLYYLIGCVLWIGCRLMTECRGAEPLQVVADFEGASVAQVEIDQAERTIRFTPGGDPARGWPCWWYFRVDGAVPGRTLSLYVRGSKATVSREVAGDSKTSMVRPLAPAWAMPQYATISADGQIWEHTDKGRKEEEAMVYAVVAPAESFYVAWGPPFTPRMAEAFVRDLAERFPYATAEELCRSREGRSVPMLHVREGNLPDAQRFGIWVQARQHAWESGSSWVARGFAEWLVGDDAEAAWLRRHAEVFIVPIMDVDNTATGNGGKDALPHDHNRDWSDEPVWNETRAVMAKIATLIDAGRMDVFLDLHNPAPGDPTFFYVLDAEWIPEASVQLRDHFIALAYDRIHRGRPTIPMSSTTKKTGPNYHPLWKQISSNWVAMHGNPHTVSLCLETMWNHANSTTEGYRAVGNHLAQATQQFLAERAEQKKQGGR